MPAMPALPARGRFPRMSCRVDADDRLPEVRQQAVSSRDGPPKRLPWKQRGGAGWKSVRIRPMKIAKLSSGKVVRLLCHDQPVAFSTIPGWSLVARPIEAPITQQAWWWVQSTAIVWVLDF